MKIRYLQDANSFGAGTVAEHDEPTCNALISQGIAETVPEGTKARKYPLSAKTETFCVPPTATIAANTTYNPEGSDSITTTQDVKTSLFTKNKR